MDSSTFITIVTALATLLGAASPIILALIQANKEKQKSVNGILLPSSVVLHHPKNQTRWFVILSFAFLGGIVGYGGAKLASASPLNEVPTITATVPIASETPEPTFTNSVPTETPTFEFTITSTSTSEPTPLPTPDVHLGIESGCIDERFWTAYDGKDIKTNGNGCLQLSDWGFFAQDKVLYFLPPQNSDSQSHSIYTTLSGNVDITFNFQVDKIQTGTRQANIRMGIVSSNNGDGKFLTYHYLPEYQDYLYPKLWQDGHYGDPFSISMKKGNAQKVNISIRDNFLTIMLDDQVVVDKLVLRFDKRLFWIDYFLPPSSELSAYISEFSIVGK